MCIGSVIQTETQKSLFCVRPCSLLTIVNFSERGPTDNDILMSFLLLVAETKRGKGYSRYKKSSLEIDKQNFKTSKISLQKMLHRKKLESEEKLVQDSKTPKE